MAKQNDLNNYKIGASIPVICMLDEKQAKDFYVEFLGFEIEWEHRFHDESPLYMQIKLGGATIHLDGHTNNESPKSTVRIPVGEIESFHEQLLEPGSEYAKELKLVRPRGTNLELPICDPSDNLIIFWEQ